VIYRNKLVSLSDISCPRMGECTFEDDVIEFSTDQVIHVWPQYDLAAIEIPEEALPQLDGYTLLEVAFGESTPDGKDDIEVWGSTFGAEVVAPSVGKVRHYTPAGFHARKMIAAKKNIRTVRQILGDVGEYVDIVKYEVTCGTGYSGGPVIGYGNNKVFAVHRGGVGGYGWGIVLSRLRTSLATEYEEVTLSSWENYTFGKKAYIQAASMVASASEHKRKDFSWHITATASGEYQLSALQFDPGAFSAIVMLAATINVAKYNVDSGRHALGIRLGLGYAGGKYAITYKSPTGQTLESFTRAHHGGLLEVGLHLQLLRLKIPRVSLDAGIRLNPTYLEQPATSQKFHFAYGIPIRVSLAFGARMGLASIGISVSLVPQWIPNQTRKYTGAGGELAPQKKGTVFDLASGFGVFFRY
jgi:hypothetical protein